MKFYYKRWLFDLLMLWGLLGIGLILPCRLGGVQESVQQGSQVSIKHVHSEEEYSERPHSISYICKSL